MSPRREERVGLESIVKEEYRAYQIYTLMDRAIPYLQDGLKPCQRRILYTLWKHKNKGLIKVSAATGLVLTLHPHGPASIEASIVNLAQDFTFSNNYPLIDKKGYFGERMEPTPAASRYIECHLGAVAEILLFDDMNQVEMVPNFDEKASEPLALWPKLPLMLLNGSEGIGTGFSSVIPSFHHKDLIRSIKHCLEKGRPRRLRPFVHHYAAEIGEGEKGKLIFPMTLEEQGEKIVITELPRGFHASKIYRYLGRFIEQDQLKDFIDSSVDNRVHIELVFKRGQTPSLAEAQKLFGTQSTLTPNYTLISERGVKIFDRPEDIIALFAQQRLKIIQRRYELRCEDLEKKIGQNKEIIRFIREKRYDEATKIKNRKSFVEHLEKHKFQCANYLADMPIYRMTKEEVQKRKALLDEQEKALKSYRRIARSKTLVQKELVRELDEVGEKLDNYLKNREKGRKDRKGRRHS